MFYINSSLTIGGQCFFFFSFFLFYFYPCYFYVKYFFIFVF